MIGFFGTAESFLLGEGSAVKNKSLSVLERDLLFWLALGNFAGNHLTKPGKCDMI
jgi:hypothetical protein